jgi:citrate synthase
MSEIAQIIVNGKTYELPLIRGTENELAIDISKFRDQSGIITLDPGFKNTGSTTSFLFVNSWKFTHC